jgi:hypothetical protein
MSGNPGLLYQASMRVQTANISTQDVDETPDYTEDSDTNPNTTASSVVGEPLTTDGRKRRSEATQLRRSVFGKKHDILGESKVSSDIFQSMRNSWCNC